MEPGDTQVILERLAVSDRFNETLNDRLMKRLDDFEQKTEERFGGFNERINSLEGSAHYNKGASRARTTIGARVFQIVLLVVGAGLAGLFGGQFSEAVGKVKRQATALPPPSTSIHVPSRPILDPLPEGGP